MLANHVHLAETVHVNLPAGRPNGDEHRLDIG